MSKLQYFRYTNFQKSPSDENFFQAHLNFQYWWPKVPWFGQIKVWNRTSNK